MIPAVGNAVAVVSRSRAFLKRQPRDWKVTVARTSLHRFAYQMIFPYLSIYIIALGASATQLGFVNSVGIGMAAIASPIAGWLVDKIGIKKIYLAGITFLAVAYLTYSIAQSWTVTIFAMVAYWVGFATSVVSCATVCGNCLTNEDRATGMSFCETVAAGLLGMAGPMLGAWLVARSGGVTITGIRPLFFIGLAAAIGSFFLVLLMLSDLRWGTSRGAKPSFFSDMGQVFKEGRNLKRWLVIASIAHLPAGMVFPFSQLFAYQVKGADQYVLGAMVTGCALTSVVFAIPLGRLADKVGRKKVIYMIVPLFWASNLMLIWAPSPAFLIVVGVLQGFYYIAAPISAAIERELVPATQMGSWSGIVWFFKMLLNACVAFVAGMTWDRFGPQYVFLIYIGLDLAIRLPLLVSMPETLHSRLGTQN